MPSQHTTRAGKPLSLAEFVSIRRREERASKAALRRGLPAVHGEVKPSYHKLDRPARFALPAQRHQVLRIDLGYGTRKHQSVALAVDELTRQSVQVRYHTIA
jgi:hypothetical protein